MNFGDIVKCPTCNTSISADNITIKRKNIIKDNTEDYFDGSDEKLCRKQDNLFVKAFCPKCDKKFAAMILINVEPSKCYSADGTDDLVIIEN